MTDSSDEGNQGTPDATGNPSGSAPDPGDLDAPSIEELNAELQGIEVRDLIAHGGMGSVFKAYQSHLDRTVAVKVLPKHTSTDPEWAEHFRTEARAMAKLHHTNIVTVHDFGETESGLIYFVMEHVEGKTMFELLHEQPISEKNAIAIVSQVCDALKYAHDHGVVHRDIKTANIMLHDADGLVKVADFGLAKLQHDAMPGLGDSSYGTPEYAPPEVTDPKATIDHRADIYSTGVLLYELLVGHPPDPNEVFVPPSKRAEVDPRLDQVVIHAMQVDPANRYQDAAAFRTALDDVRTGAALPPPDAKALKPRTSAAGGSLGERLSHFDTGNGGNGGGLGNLPIAKIAAVILAVVIGWALISSTNNDDNNDTAQNPPPENTDPIKPDDPGPVKPDDPGPPDPPTPPEEVDPELAKFLENANKPPVKPDDPDPVKPDDPDPIKPVEPELNPEQKKMVELEEAMLAVYGKEIGDEYTKSVFDLNEKYLAALKRLEEAQADAANLDGVLAAQKEAKRVKEEGGHPPPAGPDVPAVVASAQKTYSDALRKLEADHDDGASAFLRSYDIRLNLSQENLTKQGKIDDAIHLRNFRNELKKQFGSKGEKLRQGVRLRFVVAAAPPRRPGRAPERREVEFRPPPNRPERPRRPNPPARPEPEAIDPDVFPLKRPQVAGRIIAIERSDGTGIPLDKNVIPVDTENVVQIETSNSGSASIQRLAGHGLALLADGRIEGWGSNTDGQIDIPSGLSDVVDIATMYKTSVALKSDGTVVAWGNNENGECDVPSDLENVIDIEAGESHCLALKADGTVVGWGENKQGQCDAPLRRKYKDIAAGAWFSAGITTTGQIICWGANDKGQKDVPETAAKAVTIDAAGNYGMAIFDTGEVAMWGDFVRTIPLSAKPIGLSAGYWWKDFSRTAAIQLENNDWEIFGNELRLQTSGCIDLAYWRSYIIGVRP